MSKHIVLPTNTSDLDTIKKVLDYLYNNMSVEFNVDDFRNETHYTSGDSHKLAFLDYFSIINRTNGSIEFKLTAQFIYLYWNITEIRNKLLILSWLCSYLPSTWNRTNYPDKKCYIICELFEIILNNKNSDINIIDKKIKDFLSNEKNLVENSNEELEKTEENLDTKLNKILVYFKGILKNLGVLLNNNTSLNLELLENIEVWIDKLKNNNFNIDSLKNIIQSILKDISKEKFEIKTELKSLPYQKIVYGAPGTGKSYSLNKEAESTFGANIERVTFYDGYTYGQFIGMYKPIMTEEGDIGYKYVPGPFIKQLVKAYKDFSNKFCLIIEEINRAKADKVFGNIFQLLDRDEKGDSRYPISVSEEQLQYLREELEDKMDILERIENKGLYLPDNLYIWATMNSADDGVQPLDTAFKRRWKFNYISLNANEAKFGTENEFIIGTYKGEFVFWNKFRKALNNKLKDRITEDRLIAPFFISSNDFEENSELGKKVLNQDIFIEKVLMYIFDDLLRHYPKKREQIFKNGISTFSDIVDKNKVNSEEEIQKGIKEEENFLEKVFLEDFIKEAFIKEGN